jgi:uncharacterized protein (TIGR02001 family)
MKRTVLVAAAVLGAITLPAISHAEDNPLSFNVSLTSDYRYRGISQSRLRPALQGGVDYALPAGFYVGAWASTIKWIKDIPGGGGGVEIDLFGGLKGEITKELTYDVGLLNYQYPSNKLTPSANTTELYGALSFGPATVKYSHAVTNTFANADSKNSFYLEAVASFDVGGGVTLAPHVGYQKIKGPNQTVGTYTDYSLTASVDLSGFIVSAAIVGTNADKVFYSSPVNGKELGKPGLVLAVKKTF